MQGYLQWYVWEIDHTESNNIDALFHFKFRANNQNTSLEINIPAKTILIVQYVTHASNANDIYLWRNAWPPEISWVRLIRLDTLYAHAWTMSFGIAREIPIFDRSSWSNRLRPTIVRCSRFVSRVWRVLESREMGVALVRGATDCYASVCFVSSEIEILPCHGLVNKEFFRRTELLSSI